MNNPLSGSESKLPPAVFGLAMAGAVLWPVVQNWRENPKDSFPLSYYPMFSLKRQKATTARYLVGVDANGERCLIPHLYAGTGGLNQVRRQINRIVREGRAEILCKSVAEQIARDGGGEFADVVTVQVVVGRYRLLEYFAERRESVWERLEASKVKEETIAASCPVERDRYTTLRAVEDPA